jgi:hypothetical protein
LRKIALVGMGVVSGFAVVACASDPYDGPDPTFTYRSADLGANWPFMADSITVTCADGVEDAQATVDGVKYAIAGRELLDPHFHGLERPDALLDPSIDYKVFLDFSDRVSNDCKAKWSELDGESY